MHALYPHYTKNVSSRNKRNLKLNGNLRQTAALQWFRITNNEVEHNYFVVSSYEQMKIEFREKKIKINTKPQNMQEATIVLFVKLDLRNILKFPWIQDFHLQRNSIQNQFTLNSSKKSSNHSQTFHLYWSLRTTKLLAIISRFLHPQILISSFRPLEITSTT